MAIPLSFILFPNYLIGNLGNLIYNGCDKFQEFIIKISHYKPITINPEWYKQKRK